MMMMIMIIIITITITTIIIITTTTYLPTLENQKTEYKVLRGREATEGGGGGGRGVSPLPR